MIASLVLSQSWLQNNMGLVMIGIGIFIVIVIIASIFQTRCPKCGKFFAGKVIDSERTGSSHSTDHEGHRRSTVHFIQTLECKNCRNVWTRKGSKTR